MSGIRLAFYSVKIHLDTLDNLIAKATSKHRVALLKVDVEGHEAEVLEGAFQTLQSDGPIVAYEATDASASELT